MTSSSFAAPLVILEKVSSLTESWINRLLLSVIFQYADELTTHKTSDSDEQSADEEAEDLEREDSDEQSDNEEAEDLERDFQTLHLF